MSVSPVGFSATVNTTSSSAFKDMIAKPQAYSTTANSVAASGLNGEQKKKTSLPKKIAKIVVVAAGAAALLALGHKKGVFALKEGGNKYINGVKQGLDKAGEFVAEKFTLLKDKIMNSSQKGLHVAPKNKVPHVVKAEFKNKIKNSSKKGLHVAPKNKIPHVVKAEFNI